MFDWTLDQNNVSPSAINLQSFILVPLTLGPHIGLHLYKPLEADMKDTERSTETVGNYVGLCLQILFFDQCLVLQTLVTQFSAI